MKRSEASKLVAVLFAAFPRCTRNMPRGTAALYERALANFTADGASVAVDTLIRTARFLPPVSEVIETCAEAGLEAVTPAESAWSEVLTAVSKFGRYRRPEFENPLTAQAVASVGWEAICNSETPGVERAHFISAYRASANSARRARQLSGLTGGAREILRLVKAGDA
jgi:hypothetical protein